MRAHIDTARHAAPLRDVRTHRENAVRAVAAQVVGPDIEIRPAAGVRGSHWLAVRGARAATAVLYLHSGGYGAGEPAMCRDFAARLAHAAATAVLLPGYRLAPEHPFPAALDDAVAAYRSLLGTHPARRIAVGGGSSGGGLALATLVRARDGGLPMPAACFLLSPWVDLSLDSLSGGADPLNTPEYLRVLAANYLASTPADRPLASPLFADLRGLPPLHVEVGGTERLLDDSLRLTSVAARAGLTTSLSVVEGALHCFPHTAPDTPETAAAIDRIAQHLRTHLDSP